MTLTTHPYAIIGEDDEPVAFCRTRAEVARVIGAEANRRAGSHQYRLSVMNADVLPSYHCPPGYLDLPDTDQVPKERLWTVIMLEVSLQKRLKKEGRK